MLLIEEMLKSRNVTYWLVTSAMSCNYTVSFGINRVFWFRFNFVLLYLAIIFMLTGMVPADEQDWVFSERDGREVGCVPRSGADAVLNIGSAFHGEELGGGRGTPENQKKSTIWWEVFYTTQTYCIKHEVHFKKAHIFLHVHMRKCSDVHRQATSFSHSDIGLLRNWPDKLNKSYSCHFCSCSCFLH